MCLGGACSEQALSSASGLVGAAKSALWKIAPGAIRAWYGPAVWHYSIGIYSGDSPFSLKPDDNASNPVISRDDVTDVPAGAVADPFMCRVGGAWYMFFEIVNQLSWRGEIAFATSADGYSWRYGGRVLQEPFHMSYPHVFQWQDDFYMIPETGAVKSVRLYRAEQFPDRWEYLATILDGGRFVDNSIFRYRDRWWLFTEAGAEHMKPSLRLYVAPDLVGPWAEHPDSPVADHRLDICRPAGRVVEVDNAPMRLAQSVSLDVTVRREIRALRITELSDQCYREEAVQSAPMLPLGEEPWNAGGAHHMDVHELQDGRWIACVDGLHWQ